MVTGHRPTKLGGYHSNPTQLWVRSALRETLIEAKNAYPDLEVISGMALGVDQWWAELAVELDIPFHAYVPFKGQEGRWPNESKAKYSNLLEQAKTVNVVCDGSYAVWKMQKRNEAMVDDATACVAVWDETTGGTGNCVNYINKVNKPLYHINPTVKTRKWIIKL
jgi:uncharacterized phage-like protein YoqJ